jgi:non-ribosomal peptide synthetase component F
MASQYITLLSTICNDSKAPSGSYKILSPEDEYRIISSWIATEKPFTQTLCIHELISLQAQKTPCAIAVVANGQSLTYKDLDVHSNKLARLMQNRGEKAEVPLEFVSNGQPEWSLHYWQFLKRRFLRSLDPY